GAFELARRPRKLASARAPRRSRGASRDGPSNKSMEDIVSHEIKVEDVEYLRHGDVSLLARLYRPQGAGPFPIMVELHGGAWCRSDRLADKVIHEPLAKSGVIVAAHDWREPPGA